VAIFTSVVQFQGFLFFNEENNIDHFFFTPKSHQIAMKGHFIQLLWKICCNSARFWVMMVKMVKRAPVFARTGCYGIASYLGRFFTVLSGSSVICGTITPRRLS
jgi:hypothetical protein